MLIDPINIIGIITGKLLLVKDIFYLYEVITLVRLIIIAVGVQLLINTIVPKIKKYWYFVFFIILLSSFSINSYHQNGAFLFFSYLPFVLLFIIRFLRSPNWINAIMLGYFTGISFQSYHFAATGTVIFIFIVLYLLFNRQNLKVIWNNRLKATISVLLFIIFSAPAWSLVFYRSYIYPYSRFIFNQMEHVGIFISDINILRNSLTASGQWGDFLSLGLLPLAAEPYTGKIFNSFDLTIPSLGGIAISEMNMYLAFIPFILGLVGIFVGKNNFKIIFLILLFLSGCLFLGPSQYNYIYTGLFYAFPTVRVIENTHIFATFFLFFYLYFVSLGLIFIISKIKKDMWKKIFVALIFIITIVELNLYVYKIYGDQSGGISLLRKDRIVEDNIGVIDSYDVEEIMLPNLSENERSLFLNYYGDKGEYYKLREGVSIYESATLINIIEKFLMLGINVESSEFNFTSERVKTVLPYSFISSREKSVYNSSDIKVRLNFMGQIKKIPTAIDYFLEHNYNLNLNTPPKALTMPVLYKNILRSEVSQELKGILLGVELPIFEFYTDYIYLDSNEIINPEKNDIVLDYLDDRVILSEDNYFQKNSNGINSIDGNYQIEIIDYYPNNISLKIDTPEDGVLLFRDGYSPGWRAVIDKNPQNVMRTNYNQKAVFIERGIHEVEFIFRPKAFLISIYLYFVGSGAVMIFLIFYFIYHSFYKKRQSSKPRY